MALLGLPHNVVQSKPCMFYSVKNHPLKKSAKVKIVQNLINSVIIGNTISYLYRIGREKYKYLRSLDLYCISLNC